MRTLRRKKELGISQKIAKWISARTMVRADMRRHKDIPAMQQRGRKELSRIEREMRTLRQLSNMLDEVF